MNNYVKNRENRKVEYFMLKQEEIFKRTIDNAGIFFINNSKFYTS